MAPDQDLRELLLWFSMILDRLFGLQTVHMAPPDVVSLRFVLRHKSLISWEEDAPDSDVQIIDHGCLLLSSR